MYMSIIESEAEIEKACDAFFSAYKKDLLKIEHTWKNTFDAARENDISLKSLVKTSELTKYNLKITYDDNINKFLYVYFRNKPESIHEEVIEICKSAVRQNVYKELERIFD